MGKSDYKAKPAELAERDDGRCGCEPADGADAAGSFDDQAVPGIHEQVASTPLLGHFIARDSACTRPSADELSLQQLQLLAAQFGRTEENDGGKLAPLFPGLAKRKLVHHRQQLLQVIDVLLCIGEQVRAQEMISETFENIDRNNDDENDDDKEEA